MPPMQFDYGPIDAAEFRPLLALRGLDLRVAVSQPRKRIWLHAPAADLDRLWPARLGHPGRPITVTEQPETMARALVEQTRTIHPGAAAISDRARH
jgi:hypothetical protein